MQPGMDLGGKSTFLSSHRCSSTNFIGFAGKITHANTHRTQISFVWQPKGLETGSDAYAVASLMAGRDIVKRELGFNLFLPPSGQFVHWWLPTSASRGAETP